MIGVYNPYLINNQYNSMNTIRTQIEQRAKTNQQTQSTPAQNIKKTSENNPEDIVVNIDPEYENKVQSVIDYWAKGSSPVKARDIIQSSQRTGTPVDMYLTAGAIESHFGTRGRATFTNNIYNVGNVDSGANEKQNNWISGLDRFGNLISNEYFPGETPSLDEYIARDFRRPDGARYMSSQDAKSNYISISQTIRNMLK